jgi:hypothetical protein
MMRWCHHAEWLSMGVCPLGQPVVQALAPTPLPLYLLCRRLRRLFCRCTCCAGACADSSAAVPVVQELAPLPYLARVFLVGCG